MKAGRPRIAVLRALKLGDFLTAVPAFRSLRAGFPGGEITLMGLPWASEMVDRFSPYLDRFVEYPGFPGLEETDRRHPLDDFFAEQASYQYDLALQMHGAGPESNRFVGLLGAAETAGLSRNPDGDGLTAWAPYPDNLAEVHRALRVAELVGCAVRRTDLEFPLTDDDRAEASSLLADGPGDCPVIGIHPGASGGMERRWSPGAFAQVADALAARTQSAIVLTGSRAEAEINATVRASMGVPALDLSGKTTLGGLAAVIERLDLFICNDTGPAHLADALRVPSVTIFGPADPRRWGSLDARLHPWLRQPVAAGRVVELAMSLLPLEEVA